MSEVVTILKDIGRALRRFLLAVGRFFRDLANRLTKGVRKFRLERSIAKKEDAIEELFAEIGRNYFEAHADDPEELLAELCGAVKDDASDIAGYQAKIEALETEFREAKAVEDERAEIRRQADREASRAEKEAIRAQKEAASSPAEKKTGTE